MLTLKVDAFTERPLKGNACALAFEADSLEDVEAVMRGKLSL